MDNVKYHPKNSLFGGWFDGCVGKDTHKPGVLNSIPRVHVKMEVENQLPKTALSDHS